MAATPPTAPPGGGLGTAAAGPGSAASAPPPAAPPPGGGVEEEEHGAMQGLQAKAASLKSAARGMVDEEEGMPERKKVSRAKTIKGAKVKARAKGDYDVEGRVEWRVVVLVEEARELQPRDANAMSDPFVKVSALGGAKRTTQRKKTVNCEWREVLHFTAKLTDGQFSAASILFQVYDGNTFRKNAIIGQYAISIPWIYERDDHELRTWLGLSELAKYAGIQGYLKVAVAVLGPGDRLPASITGTADADADADAAPLSADNLQAMALMPPLLDADPHQLTFNVHKAVGLPKLDRIGSIDSFVAVSFAGQRAKTKVRKKDRNPEYNQALLLPVMLPTMCSTIDVAIYDYDRASANDLVARFALDFAPLLAKPLAPTWLYMYGVPGSASFAAAFRSTPSFHPDYATEYYGALLVSASLVPAPRPVNSVSSISWAAEPPALGVFLWLDVYELVQLALDSSKARVVLRCGAMDAVVSPKLKLKHGRAAAFVSLPPASATVPRNTAHRPDILVVVQARSGLSYTDAAFLRFRLNDVLAAGKKAKPTWHHLRPIAPDSDADTFAGLALITLTAGDEAKAHRFPPRFDLVRPPTDPYVLRVYVFQARDLAATAADESEAFLDPYVVATCGSSSARTLVIPNSTAPAWYEVLELTVDVPEDALTLAPLLHIEAFDDDSLADDTLGHLTLPLAKMTRTLPRLPQWYDLYHGTPDNTRGQILCSFQLLPAHEADDFPPPPSIVPPLTDVSLAITLIGCRELVPRASLRALKSISVSLEAGAKHTLVKSHASAVPAPSDPNFLTTLELDVEVATHAVFAPSLTARVYDRKSNFIGSALIPLAPFVPSIVDRPRTDPAPAVVVPYASAKARLSASKKGRRRKSGSASGEYTGSDNDSGDEYASSGAVDSDDGSSDASGSWAGGGRKRKRKAGKKASKKGKKASKKGKASSSSSGFAMSESEYHISWDGVDPAVANDETVRLLRQQIADIKHENETLKVKVKKVSKKKKEVEELNQTLRAVASGKGKGKKKASSKKGKKKSKKKKKKKKGQASTDSSDEYTMETLDSDEIPQWPTEYGSDGEIVRTMPPPRPRRLVPDTSSGSGSGGGGVFSASSSSDSEASIGEERPVVSIELEKLLTDVPFKTFPLTYGALKLPAGEIKLAVTVVGGSSESDGNDEYVTGSSRLSSESYEDEEEEEEEGGRRRRTKKTRVRTKKKTRRRRGGGESESDDDDDDDDDDYDDDDDDEEYGESEEYDETESEAYGDGGSSGLGCESSSLVSLSGTESTSVEYGATRAIPAVRFGKMGEEMLRVRALVVRVYVLRASGLVPGDVGGSCDPYLVLRHGPGKSVVIDDVKHRFKSTLAPEFARVYEFPVELCGASEVAVEVWDYDKVSGNDLVGATTLDLEDRFFSAKWQAWPLKPIEQRVLTTPAGRGVQGAVDMWVDILDPEYARRNPPVSLAAHLPQPYELRVIVFDTKKVRLKDKNMSDIFVSMAYNEGPPQRSDIHYRSKTGEGNFNFRYVFGQDEVVLGAGSHARLKIQVFDKDNFNANDALCETILDLNAFVKKGRGKKDGLRVKKQWVKMTHPAFVGISGKIQLSLELLPAALAAAYPVGKGRKDPNANPYLPPPNRPRTSYPPWAVHKKFQNFLLDNKITIAILILLAVALAIGAGILYYLAFKKTAPPPPPASS